MGEFKYNIKEVVDFLGGGLDEAIVFNLITVFIKSINDELPVLGKAVEENDRPMIHKVGHKLKGSSANLGFERFRKLCEDLEQHARHDLDFNYEASFKLLLNEKDEIINWYNSEKSKYGL